MPSRYLIVATFTLLAVLGRSARCTEAAPEPGAQPAEVIAINILLLPDRTMTAAAEVLNVRIRERDSAGFVFDDTHVPHISLLHRYIDKADLAKVQSAVARTIAKLQPAGWQLRATRLESAPWDHLAVVNIAIERTPELARLQSALVAALAPIALKNGSARAFVQLPNDPEASQTTVDYVRSFVPKATGRNFQPHITVGLGSRKVMAAIGAEVFTPMTFAVSQAAIFQLGDVGTARKILWRSDEQRPSDTPTQVVWTKRPADRPDA